MKKILLFILLIPIVASAQTRQRYDSFAATTTSASGIGNLTQVIPNATITVFNQPAVGVSCAGGGCVAATTYTAATGGAACGGGLPLTRPTANTCLSTADSQGNFGFWATSGAYQYCIAATSITTQCYNVNLDSANAVLHAVQFAGSDIGAQVNAAYASSAPNCPSTGCHIKIDGGSYSYSTPIVCGTNLKPCFIDGDYNQTQLTFTPSTGAAITLDGGQGHLVGGLTGINLTCSAVGNTAKGLQLSSVNGGESVYVGYNRITNCQSGDIFTGAGNVYFDTFEHNVIGFNGGTGTCIVWAFQTENVRFSDNVIAQCATGLSYTGTGGYISGRGNSWDDNTTVAISITGGGKYSGFTEHFENVAGGTSQYATINPGSFVLYSGELQEDRCSGTQGQFITMGGSNNTGNFIIIRDTHLIATCGGTQSVTQAVNISGTPSAFFQMGNFNPTKILADYNTAYISNMVVDCPTESSGNTSLQCTIGNQKTAWINPPSGAWMVVQPNGSGNAWTWQATSNPGGNRTINMIDPAGGSGTYTAGLSYNTGSAVYQTGTGAGCTTAASIGGVCASPATVTFTTSFADTNYKVSCSPNGAPTQLPSTPYLVTKSAGSVTVNYFAITANAASWPNIECVAVHN